MFTSTLQLPGRHPGQQCSRRQYAGRVYAAAQQTQVKPVIGKAAEKRKLGDSDLLVSACCAGTMTWGKQNTEAQAHEQLSYYFDCGINFMDTAELYPVPPAAETQGLTDKYIGTWLKSTKNKREDMIVATKVAGYGDRSNYLRGGRTCRVSSDQIEESINNSLQRLGVDYVDLLQIHWPDRYVPLFGGGAYDQSLERDDDISFEEQLRGLEKIIKAGKVRYIGVSNETSYGVMSFCHAAEQFGLPKVVSIQNAYSLLVRSNYETDLAEVCAARQTNVGLLAYSPLAGGALSGKYLSGEAPEGARLSLFPGYMARYKDSLSRTATAEYKQIAEKYGLTLVQLALAFVHSRWFVTSSIIGATSMEQLSENIASFDMELSEECLAEIAAVYKKYRDPTIF